MKGVNMRVVVDGQPLSNPPAAETLQALLDQVREGLGQGRIIVAVTVNARPLVGDALSMALAEAPQGEITLETANAPEVVASAFRDVANQLNVAGSAQADLAARLNADGVASVAPELGAFCGIWANCQKTLNDAGALLQRDFGAFEYDGETLTTRLASLSEKLRELRDAFDHRDFMLAADLLQFEMPEQCATWSQMMGEIAADVEKVSA
ncbi:MAG: hypothetical protein KDA32_02675 [Phycisphaerales bacterium]|nr:hypothetical protein [Phycisphaerales bacterium]